MTKSVAPWALGCLLLSGCGQSPSVTIPAGKFVWERSERPYKVLGVTESSVPRIGDQTRSVLAVYSAPSRRDEVADALKEIYTALKEDIEKSQPDAAYRRINIKIYDSAGDAEHDPGAWLCFLQLAPEAGAKFSEWPSESVAWQWRDPESMPAARDRKIEWEYLGTLDEINRSVEFPVMETDFAGKSAAESRAFIEQRYVAESQELKRQLAVKHRMTVEELEQLLDRILNWKYGSADQPPQ